LSSLIDSIKETAAASAYFSNIEKPSSSLLLMDESSLEIVIFTLMSPNSPLDGNRIIGQ